MYAYCGNNSLNCVDPTGLYKEFCITYNPSPTAANQVNVYYFNVGSDSAEYYSYEFAHYGAFASALDRGDLVFPDNIPSDDANFVVVHFIGSGNRITSKTFTRICAGLGSVFIDTHNLTIIDPYYVPYEWDWDELWNGFWTGYSGGCGAVIDGIIPIWDPFASYYANDDGSIDGVFQFSQDMGALARDLVIFASGRPTCASLKTYVGNIYNYEKGSLTVAKDLWDKISKMDVISRGKYLKSIGVGAFGRGSLPQFIKTIKTGGTPLANLTLIGVLHASDR